MPLQHEREEHLDPFSLNPDEHESASFQNLYPALSIGLLPPGVALQSRLNTLLACALDSESR